MFALGAFVVAACRSLTLGAANGDRLAVETLGTGAFVGELRGSCAADRGHCELVKDG